VIVSFCGWAQGLQNFWRLTDFYGLLQCTKTFCARYLGHSINRYRTFMNKQKIIFTCSFCGYQAPKWLGKCPDCDQWNTFYEEICTAAASCLGQSCYGSKPTPITVIKSSSEERVISGINEFDRVLGGGIVPGTVILIGGDPGIGKSTLVLQVASHLAHQGQKILYVSGEESLRQLRMRAERLGTLPANLFMLAHNTCEQIVQEAKMLEPSALIIDSVQTIYTPDLESAPGSVSQVRETSSRLISHAKSNDMTTFLIGHVTKEGAIAGPRVLEHMVDTVLYFEGDRSHVYRILRSVKNRFGSTDEIGVFEMGGTGLQEVSSPSEIFISERPAQAPGSTIVSSIEGTRPILVEIQALVAPTPLSFPRRTAIGLDQNRVAVMVAILEKRAGLTLYNQDIFLNIAGGVRLSEPGVDLGVIISIVSSHINKPLPTHTAVCGEVGLTGEVRAVHQIQSRVKEASRLGFNLCIVPKKNLKNNLDQGKMNLFGVDTIQETIDHLFS